MWWVVNVLSCLCVELSVLSRLCWIVNVLSCPRTSQNTFACLFRLSKWDSLDFVSHSWWGSWRRCGMLKSMCWRADYGTMQSAMENAVSQTRAQTCLSLCNLKLLVVRRQICGKKNYKILNAKSDNPRWLQRSTGTFYNVTSNSPGHPLLQFAVFIVHELDTIAPSIFGWDLRRCIPYFEKLFVDCHRPERVSKVRRRVDSSYI